MMTDLRLSLWESGTPQAPKASSFSQKSPGALCLYEALYSPLHSAGSIHYP